KSMHCLLPLRQNFTLYKYCVIYANFTFFLIKNMSKLNKDVLYLIFKELQDVKDNKKTIFSCLTVSKTWCETAVPVLWKNPWKYNYSERKKLLLLNVIVSHLSDETRSNLKSKGVDLIFWTNSYQRPSFNYISFCRHLNLNNLNETI